MELIVPALAVQLVAPAEVNWKVFPRTIDVAVGEMVCGATGTRVTVALPEPPGPVAVIVTDVLDGRLEGAV